MSEPNPLVDTWTAVPASHQKQANMILWQRELGLGCCPGDTSKKIDHNKAARTCHGDQTLPRRVRRSGSRRPSRRPGQNLWRPG